MNESEIRAYFAKNWVFVLLKRFHYPIAIVFGIPLVIFAAGAIIAALTQNFDLFRCNLLAYPIGIGVALAAYCWFAVNFPKYLSRIYPAFDTSADEYSGIIKKWARRIANNYLVIGSASLIVGLLNFQNLNDLWQPGTFWLGDLWVNSPSQLFFKSYYGFIDIAAGGIILGSGAIGIIGVMLLINDLMKLKLKLSHTRLLRYMGDLSIGLTVWTLLAFAFVGPIRAISAPNILCTSDIVLQINSKIILSNLIISIISAIAFITALLLPVFLARAAIMGEKNNQIDNLLEIQHDLYIKVDELTELINGKSIDQTAAGQASAEIGEIQPLLKDLQGTYESIASVNKIITEIEAIPDWPISSRGVLQISAAAIFPILLNIFLNVAPDLVKAYFK